MNAAVDLLLALGVPFVVMTGTLLITLLLDEPSLAPERGTPLRRRTAARFRTVGSTLAFTCWGIAVGGRLLRVEDNDRWLEWFYVIVGLSVWLLGWLDDRDDRP